MDSKKPGETTPRPISVPVPETPPSPTAPETLARGTGPLASEPAPDAPNRLYRRLVVALSAVGHDQQQTLRQLVASAGRTPANVTEADIRLLEGALRLLADAHAVPYERALAHAKLDSLIAELS